MDEHIHEWDKKIGERIRDGRKRAKMTQAELAQKVGLATITIRQYESGKRIPKIQTLVKLAAALNVPAESLYYEPTFDEIFKEERLNIFLSAIETNLLDLNPLGQELVSDIAIELAKKLSKIQAFAFEAESETDQ